MDGISVADLGQCSGPVRPMSVAGRCQKSSTPGPRCLRVVQGAEPQVRAVFPGQGCGQRAEAGSFQGSAGAAQEPGVTSRARIRELR